MKSMQLTPEQLARAEDRLRHPRRGSKIEAAQCFGIDLTLLIENLRLPTQEHVRRMESVIESAHRASQAARKPK